MLDWWWWQADFSWWHHTYGLIIPSWGEIGNVPSYDVLPNVNIPLSTTPIVHLLSLSKIALKHNFISSLLVIAGCMMALHYKPWQRCTQDAQLLSVGDWKYHCNQGCPVYDWQDTGTATKLIILKVFPPEVYITSFGGDVQPSVLRDLPANITCYVRYCYTSYRITFTPILRHAMDGHWRYTVHVSKWTDSVMFIEVRGFVLQSQLTVLKMEFDSERLVGLGRRGVLTMRMWQSGL